MPPLFVGIIFGILAIMRRRETKKSAAKIIFAVLGIFLNSMFFFLLLSQPPKMTMTAVVTDGVWNRNAKLDDGIVIGTFCTNDQWGSTVDIFEGTKIYEQYGTWFWQKRRVSVEAIQPGQIVNIQYHLTQDPELPGYSSSPLYGAEQVMIQTGEFKPYETGNCPKP
jgi:hypothetical protein